MLGGDVDDDEDVDDDDNDDDDDDEDVGIHSIMWVAAHVSSSYHNHSTSHHRITTTACLIIVSQPQHVSSSYHNHHCRTYFYGTLKLSLSQEHEVVALVRRLFRSWDEMLALHCSHRTDVYNLVHWFHEDLICRGETSTHSTDGR